MYIPRGLMQALAVVRLLLVFVHLLAFAAALGCVLREDVKLLSRQPIDPASLRSAARLVCSALAVLWVSGLALIVLDTGGDVSRVAGNPKLLAKLSVVSVLTLNGVALHCLAFPALCGKVRHGRHTATTAALLGAISAASWFAATFLGIVRQQARGFDYADFMLGYGAMIAVAIAFGLTVVRPRMRRKLDRAEPWYEGPVAHARGDVPRFR